MTSLVLGLFTAAASFYGLLRWSASSGLVQLFFSLSFLCGGSIAVLAGLSSFKNHKK